MGSLFIDGLSMLTQDHIRLSRTRRETLCWLVFLFLRQGSVCLWRLAAHAPSRAQTASVQRRFYRFFQFAHLKPEDMARLIIALPGLKNKPLTLEMDRTNWMFGRTHINILMIPVMWHGVGIPLIWSLLPGAGNSSTSTRTDLFDHLYQALPDMKIASFTGDREFIGDKWMQYLARAVRVQTESSNGSNLLICPASCAVNRTHLTAKRSRAHSEKWEPVFGKNAR